MPTSAALHHRGAAVMVRHGMMSRKSRISCCTRPAPRKTLAKSCPCVVWTRLLNSSRALRGSGAFVPHGRHRACMVGRWVAHGKTGACADPDRRKRRARCCCCYPLSIGASVTRGCTHGTHSFKQRTLLKESKTPGYKTQSMGSTALRLARLLDRQMQWV